MPSYLTVTIAPLSELFSGNYRFQLPWFQRAYAWQIQHVGRLLTNLFEGIAAPPEQRYYMLGNLMLAHTDNESDTAIVDGHQRILTITILFAVLRDLEPDPVLRAQLHARISRVPEGTDNQEASYHLRPQVSLVQFLDTLVQKPGATAEEPDAYPESLSETERNILVNRDYLRTQLSAESVSVETRRELVAYLEEACHVVIRMADTQENGWAMVRVEEERRLEFHPAATAKASLIGVMQPEDRAEAARIWETCQRQLAAQDTFSLINHIRAMKLRKGAGAASLEEDIARHYELDTKGLAFMKEVFEPNARAMAAIRAGTFGTDATRETLARGTKMMVWIDPVVWMPAALHWSNVRGEDAPETELFFSRLERLAWVQKLAGIDPARQETRIRHLLARIDTGVSPDKIVEFKIESALRREALDSLRRNAFGTKRLPVNVLRRISVEMGDDPSIFEAGEATTVEHIFPKSPPNSSEWMKTFPNRKQWKNYVNRLGNLTVLTPHENQTAGNQDWSKKTSVLKESKFAVSNAAAKNGSWNPKLVDERTEQLVQILFKAWGLPT